MYCGFMWLVGISTVFDRPLTVPVHSPAGRQMPVGWTMQGDYDLCMEVLPCFWAVFHLINNNAKWQCGLYQMSIAINVDMTFNIIFGCKYCVVGIHFQSGPYWYLHMSWYNIFTNIIQCNCSSYPSINQQDSSHMWKSHIWLCTSNSFENGDFWQTCPHSHRQNGYF